MGYFQMNRARTVYNKKANGFDKFTVVYNRGLPNEFTRDFWTSYTKQHIASHKTPVIRSDHRKPTQYGAINFNITGSVNRYRGPINSGYSYDAISVHGPYPPDYSLKTVDRPANLNVGVQLQFSTNSLNHVLTKTRAKFAAQDISLGATLAESAETASYIAQKAGTVFGMLRAIKRGNLGAFRKHFGLTKLGHKIKPKHISRTAAERWLEWKYAVSPLINDVTTSIKIFNEGLAARHEENRPWDLKVTSTVKTDGNHEALFSYTKTTSSYTYRYHCCLYASVTDPDVHGIALLGLDLPSSLWELVPFSFVLDWAVPVGTWLQALYATNGLKFSRGYYNVTATENWLVTPVNSGSYPALKARLPYTGNLKWFYRQPLTSFPDPTIYWKSPFSTDHLITALSLLRVLRKD